MNLIKLDWDSISYCVAVQRIEKIIEQSKIIYADLFSSPSGDGFHVYIYTLEKLDALQFRQKWKDDGKRIITDILKPDNAPKDVLFQWKYINGKKYESEFMKRFAS